MIGIRLHDTNTRKVLDISERDHESGEIRIQFPGHRGLIADRVRDITRGDAHRLRDWLDDWLGDSVESTYTAEDVEGLVTAVQAYLTSYHNHIPTMPCQRLADAISPFLPPPDPDADLVEKIGAVFDEHDTFSECVKDIISIVREHDADKS